MRKYGSLEMSAEKVGFTLDGLREQARDILQRGAPLAKGVGPAIVIEELGKVSRQTGRRLRGGGRTRTLRTNRSTRGSNRSRSIPRYNYYLRKLRAQANNNKKGLVNGVKKAAAKGVLKVHDKFMNTKLGEFSGKLADQYDKLANKPVRIQKLNFNSTVGVVGRRALGVAGTALVGWEAYEKGAEMAKETGSNAAGVAAGTTRFAAVAGASLYGASKGASIGATIGTALGPAGTLIGGAVGGIIGGAIGYFAATYACDNVIDPAIKMAATG